MTLTTTTTTAATTTRDRTVVKTGDVRLLAGPTPTPAVILTTNDDNTVDVVTLTTVGTTPLAGWDQAGLPRPGYLHRRYTVPAGLVGARFGRASAPALRQVARHIAATGATAAALDAAATRAHRRAQARDRADGLTDLSTISIDATPLIDLVNARGGFVAAFPNDPTGATRRLWHRTTTTGRVSAATADILAVRLGTTPDTIWGDNWDEPTTDTPKAA